MHGTPISAEALRSLETSAAAFLETLRSGNERLAAYDRQTVTLLSHDLDQNGRKYHADDKTRKSVLWNCGAVLGRTIIELGAPGTNLWVQLANPCVRVTTSKGETVMADPFARVARHVQEGPESSILAYFIAVEAIVRNGLPRTR